MYRAFLILAAACMAAVPAASADDGPSPRRILTIDEQREWSGVGRLNLPGGGFCSGALIRPNIVLTAAHCVVDRATGRRFKASVMRFVAGLRAGVYTANRRGAEVIESENWAGYRPDGLVLTDGDVALVRLESPIINVEAKSFKLGPPPAPGDDVTLVSYGKGRANALSIQSPCQVIERYGASFSLNCDSIHGTSGAPVFHEGRVVGVVSASDLGAPPRLTYSALSTDEAMALLGEAPKTASAPRPRAGSLFKSAPSVGGRLPGGSRPPKQ